MGASGSVLQGPRSSGPLAALVGCTASSFRRSSAPARCSGDRRPRSISLPAWKGRQFDPVPDHHHIDTPLTCGNASYRLLW